MIGRSLKDLRDDLKVELRSLTGAGQPRYTDAEIDLAINRAVLELEQDFWAELTDASKAYAENTHTYTYVGISDFYQVRFQRAPNPVSFGTDWEEPQPGVLNFLKRHNAGDSIIVYYERHPIAFPDDLVTDATLEENITALSVLITGGNVYTWPSTGHLKVGQEIMSYSAIVIDTATTATLTVTRAQLNTVQPHSTTDHLSGSTVSYVNLCEKAVFFEGVKEWAISSLNRTRVTSAAVAEVQGNVTIMRQIEDQKRQWRRQHKMRSRKPTRTSTMGARPTRGLSKRW
jgi:hypothetical protein